MREKLMRKLINVSCLIRRATVMRTPGNKFVQKLLPQSRTNCEG